MTYIDESEYKPVYPLHIIVPIPR